MLPSITLRIHPGDDVLVLRLRNHPRGRKMRDYERVHDPFWHHFLGEAGEEQGKGLIDPDVDQLLFRRAVDPLHRLPVGVVEALEQVRMGVNKIAAEHHDARKEVDSFEIGEVNEVAALHHGWVVGDVSDPPKALKPNVDGFLSLVLVVRSLGKKGKGKGTAAWGIHVNYSPVVHCGTAQVACRVTAVSDFEGKETEMLTQGKRGMVWMTPLAPLVVEPVAKSPALGRFALRDSGKTVAVGIVQKVEYGKYSS